MRFNLFYLILFLLSFSACEKIEPPAPYGATPSPQQLAWHDMEYYAFVHFNINTFSDLEWGHGSESPEIFNPTQLDCRQWARVAKAAGMKGIIITAKHHDGFCLWDSDYTTHDVGSSPWRGGRGDLLQELADACKEYDLKMGLYLSPWDQNCPIYGTPEYNDYFKKQLAEVLTNYGDIFEVWFDGAVGEKFRGQQIYDWDGFIETVRTHQPNAVIFSDNGPDVRWVGTEKGFANPTNWCTLNKDDYYPGTWDYLDLRSGNQNGTHWIPAEVNTSIRPGWYYHADQDEYVKSVDHLELIYYNGVGRNGNFLLNLPVDRRGLVHEKDSAALMRLRARLDATFTNNYAKNETASASDSRGDGYGASNILDGKKETYWAATDSVRTASLEIHLKKSAKVNVVELKEYIALGQRIEAFSIEAKINDNWKEIGTGTSIGNNRYIRIPTVETADIRINILSSMASPTISEIGLYYRPHENYLLESKPDFEERMDWWRAAKFGMFIHWGPYAVPAGIHKETEIGGASEWIMTSAPIPVKDYEPYAKQFNPVNFKADEWVQIAKNAGMKYIIITSKHHDGFCLWNSETSEYDIMDFTEFGRDILMELKEACDKEGIKLGFYHSIMDWHHPQAQAPHFPTYHTPSKSNPDFENYRDNYLNPQVTELVEKYEPAVLWFDGEWIPEWSEPQGKNLYNLVRTLKPNIIINNRVGKGRKGMNGMNEAGEFVGDFGTPEQEILEVGTNTTDWESCMTMNSSWGYKMSDTTWKSSEKLIHNLVDIASKGGNYLLNVGPTAEGLIPSASIERLAEMGEWMKINGEAIYNSEMLEVPQENETIRYTHSKVDGSIHAIALEWMGEQFKFRYVKPEAGSKIYFLGHGEALEWTFDESSGLSITMPEQFMEESERPCQYAWTFKIKGKAANVTAAPTFHTKNEDQIQEKIFSESQMITMECATSDATIYFTVDGSDPTEASTVYKNQIKLTATATVRAFAKKSDLVSSPISEAVFTKSTFQGMTLKHKYADKYTAGGPLGLLDGRRGSTNFTDGRWQGFQGNDFEAMINLGETKSVNNISISFLENTNSWIFPPEKVTFSISLDGQNYKEIAAFSIATPAAERDAQIHELSKKLGGVEVKYLKVFAKNVGLCPKWHESAGEKCWVFVDEITID